MHKILSSIVMAGAALTSSVWAFDPGAEVSTESLGKAEAIKGEAPKAWEPGKVYILECWATWCGPCVAAIPHVDALYDKYKDKGLRVIGMNVWEEEKEAVEKFVKGKGDGMSYPVLFTGKEDTPFEKAYLKPGKVDGIPYAFVIKDGKFLFGGHPASIDEPLVEALIAGGEKQEAALKTINEKAKNEAAIEKLMEEFAEAEEAKDASKMAALLEKMEKLTPNNPDLEDARFSVAMAKKDWPAIDKRIAAIKDKDSDLVMVAVELDEAAEVPEATRKAILAKLVAFSKVEEETEFSPAEMNLIVSRYQWLTGDKDGAKESAKKAIATPGEIPVKILKAYAADLEAGKGTALKDLAEKFEAAEEEEGEKEK